MTKKESLKNLVAKNVFGVANMAAHYDVELPYDLEDFMEDWFGLDPGCEVTEYSFEELKDFASTVLEIVDKNPEIENEPMVKFPLSELKLIVTKSEEELLVEKDEQLNMWNAMDNISSVGLGGFFEQFGTNPEFLAAQDVIKAFLG